MPPWLLAYLPKLGKILPYVGLSIVLVFGTWWVNNRWCNNACEAAKEAHRTALAESAIRYADAVKAAQEAAERVREAKDAAGARHAAELAEERAVSERLRRAIARLQAVTRPEPTDENPTPDLRLSDSWLRCWAAQAGADPADRTACEVPGTELPR